MKLALSALLFATPLAAIAAGIRVGRSSEFAHRRQDATPIVSNVTNANAATAYSAQCSQINSAEGSAAIQADIQNATFQSIGAQLSFIDSENLDSQKFSPSNDEYSLASRTTAATQSHTVQNYNILQQYISEAQSLEASAQATAESFIYLQGNLTTFAATFQNFASQQQAQDNTQIQQLMADIASLNSKIDALQKDISGVGAALGATIFADIFAVALFPNFAPLIIGAGVLAVAGEVAAYEVLQKEMQNDYNQIASDQTQISNLQANLQAISQANSTLASIKNQTATLTTQLGAFDAIWSAVVDDANQVISYLTEANATTTIPLIFWATINNVDCYYQAMASALNDYADGISNSGIPAPTRRRSLEPLVVDHAALHATATRLVSEGQSKVRAKAEGAKVARGLEVFLPASI
ncbi:hypothetical protein BT96DRAFT_1022802 [Gymnopus androsaceus JB14]|uniref:Uncharacterized protein n=1 Tax=Gymnopus androsaceus JB14 TaxID=1447944 RepID=A0A6A4H791_9AGAR|nr:hypothetical protein BT96DRAFT_1022802 [Gymnopus androsaceus JB14]